MAFIEISNLNAAGSDLFAGADSFLTELETTETTQIFGGWRGGGWGGRRNSGRRNSGRRNSYHGGRRNSGRRNSYHGGRHHNNHNRYYC